MNKSSSSQSCSNKLVRAGYINKESNRGII
jgi:hypothetical protein